MIPKFRAWHKQFKLMKLVRKLDLDYGRVFVAIDSSKRQKTDANRASWNFNNIELMQWTGWQDAHKKDIYIGDILECGHAYVDEPYNPDLFVVKIADMGFDFEWLKRGDNTDWADGDIFTGNDLKIIGNIYSNPELLEQK